MVVVVMGVSGAGKSTVASLLADRLGWQWRDADDFHSEANKAKMHRGEPLTDADRQPWLQTMRSQIDNWVRNGEDAILACSALKRAYRQQLDAEPDVVFVYLKASSGELIERL
jgi:gluconokinase